jgi:hypothetical protein
MGAYGFVALNLSAEGGRPERINGGQLTVQAFEALGVQPRLGRGFRDGDDRPGADPVILLGYELWRDRYNSSPAVVGQSVRANGVQRTVIGVMPERFAFPILQAAWIPLTIDPLANPRGQGPSYAVIARLKPDASLAQARSQASAIAAQLEAEFPSTNRDIGADVMPYARTAVGPEIYGLLYTMLGAGIGVLLIACVASRTCSSRASCASEVAVRMALAPRGRVMRQHLTEVLVLATLGGGIGIVLSIFGMRWFTRALSVNPPPFWITFDLDYRVLLFVAGVIVMASLLCRASALRRASASAALRTIAGPRRAAASARSAAGWSSPSWRSRARSDCRRADGQERRSAQDGRDAVRD